MQQSFVRQIMCVFIILLLMGINVNMVMSDHAEIAEQQHMSDIMMLRIAYNQTGTEPAHTIYGDPRYHYDLSPFLSPKVRSDHGLMDSPWPMKCHDLHHTSRSPYNSNDGGGLEKWRFWTDFDVESPAIIDDQGMIYFAGWDRDLHALYPNGTEKWAYHTTGIVLSSPAISADGIIYVGDWGHRLHAVYASNGTRKWKIATGGSVQGSPAIAPDGTIYFSTMTGENGDSLVAVHPNGTIKWRYVTGDAMTSDPAIGDDGTIYVGSLDTYFYAINPNGTLKWWFKTGDWVKAHPAIAEDGTVYISSFDTYLYALHPDNGSLIWKYKWGGDEASPAIGPDGIIYVGNSELHVVYPNGTGKYVVDIGPNIAHASPCLSADGTLYLGAGNSIYAVDSEDGSVLWQKRIANCGVHSSPILGPDGTVYIGSAWYKRKYVDGLSSMGYLHAFGPTSSNTPPSTPVIDGNLRAGVFIPGEMKNLYTFTSTDAEHNPIAYDIRWGDGSKIQWTDEAASNETVNVAHEWPFRGLYLIRCKARDVHGAESDWAYKLVVVRYRYYLYWVFNIIDNHP